MTLKKLAILTLVFLTILGCQDIDGVQKPENVIPSEKMEDILYESILLNAAKGSNLGQFSNTGIKPESYIFEKFNVDSITFAQNMSYYATDAENFREMNFRVSQRFTKLHKELDSLNKIERAIQDSIRKCENEYGKPLAVRALDTIENIKATEVNPLKLKKDSSSNIISESSKKRRKVKDSISKLLNM